MAKTALGEYKKTMGRFVRMFDSNIPDDQLSAVLDYSIQKRYKPYNAQLNNSYTYQKQSTTLLQLTDWIFEKEPIVTAYGTMFKRHSQTINPLTTVIQQFLDTRSIHKKEMFKYPKGSEEFERYNLYQLLDKIDCNGIYGCLGQYSALIYNVNVATSITTQGRAAVSTMMCFFEAFLSNNVKFGSLDEVLTFIDHVKSEYKDRKYQDSKILDHDVSVADCFAKIIYSCGFRWVPDDREMDIIWRVVNNLGQEDLNRVYYKNNLYYFCENSYMTNLIKETMATMETPYYDPNKPPKEIVGLLDEFTSLLREYVFYNWMYVDRIDRAENMIKNICVISDTDSSIISLDAWFRFVNDITKYDHLKIQRIQPRNPFKVIEKDEYGDPVNKSDLSPFIPLEQNYDYDFENDELVAMKHVINPFVILPEDNVRFSIINMMSYALTRLVNEYMITLTKRSGSYAEGKECKLWAKNELLMKRSLITESKKNYASIQELQEGNRIPKNKQLDIKGIESMAKSNTADSTKDALKKILLEDVMNASTIDQFKIIKHIAILEKQITDSVLSGSKEFYKPATIKSAANYETPFRIQGVKGAYAWNNLKPESENLPAINLEERNAVVIAKTTIDINTVETLKEDFPEVYDNAMKLLRSDIFGYKKVKNKSGEKEVFGHIDCVSIPLDTPTPAWIMRVIDLSTIINNNIKGFTYESVGIQRLHKDKVNYTNMINL